MSLPRRAFLVWPAAAVAAPSATARILAAMQQVMGPLPRHPRRPPAVRIEAEDSSGDYIRRRIAFEAEAGDFVPAWLLLPRTAGRHPAMLCLHQTTRLGKSEPVGLGGSPNLHYGRELASRGFVVLAPDYPNFGDYPIDVYARGYVSATMKGIFNHIRAVDLLASMSSVDLHRIGAIGHSLGGHNALFAAAFDRRIRATVTSCGFTSFRRYYGGDLSGWSHKGYMPRIASVYGKSPERMPFDFTDVLAAIAPRRLFVNAPLHDANFDVAGVRECIEKVRPLFGSGLTVVYPDCAHDFPPEVRTQVYDWLAAG